MPFEHHSEELRLYPEIVPLSEQREQLTIGDLHANALLLFRTLIKYDLFEVRVEDFAHFVNLYEKYAAAKINSRASFFAASSGTSRIKEDLDRLINIIHSAKVSQPNQGRLVRLLGDELCDRGVCDYLILAIIEKMAKENIRYEILLSNHSAEFIRVYQDYVEQDIATPLSEATQRNVYLAAIYPAQYRSLSTLIELVENGYVDKADLKRIVKDYYLPYLKLVSYSLKPNENAIRIFAHAPIDLSILKALAINLAVDYKDDTIQALAGTIDSINEVFHIYLIEEAIKITNLLSKESTARISHPYGSLRKLEELKNNPNCALAWLTWNRRFDILSPAKGGEYKLSYVHGHYSVPEHGVIKVEEEGGLAATWSSLDSIYGKEVTIGKPPSGEQHILLSLEVDDECPSKEQEQECEKQKGIEFGLAEEPESEDITEPEKKRPRK